MQKNVHKICLKLKDGCGPIPTKMGEIGKEGEQKERGGKNTQSGIRPHPVGNQTIDQKTTTKQWQTDFRLGVSLP